MSTPGYLPEDPVAQADQLRALRDDLESQESAIERGLQSFVEIGRALAKIRDDRLYRQEYASFESYCQSRWNLTRKRAYDLMSAATVVDGMEAVMDMAVSPIGDTQPIPLNEGQARELSGLDPSEAVEVMGEVIESTGGKPTAASIRNAVRSRGQDDANCQPHPIVDPAPAVDLPNLPNEAYADDAVELPSPTIAPQQEPVKPKRRPITDAFNSATYELQRSVEKVVRLSTDDRLKKNKDQIVGANLSDLVRVRDAIDGVINTLEG